MARIPEAEIEKIKEEIALVRVIEAAGIALKPHGKDLVGRCPFHDDQTPSLVVSPDKNLWHCLGACQAGGTVIDWVMKAEAVSFRHAAELLRERYFPSLVAEIPRGRPASDGRAYPRHSSVKKLPELAEPSESDAALLKRVVDYYHEQLKQSPEAEEYLKRRGLGDGELIERFKLGFANRTLAYRLPAKSTKAGQELRGRLEKLGILRESGHEHLNGSVVFPIFDAEGRVVELYGRKVTAHLRKGTPLHLYLAGPHRGVWNLEALESEKEIILCESLIDAATFWCAGFRNVTCSYGVSGFTEDHWRAFREHGTERVLIAYDRDEAGDKAAEALGRKLNEAGIETARVLFPKGMDANEYALKVGPAEKSLRLVVQHAVWTGSKAKGQLADGARRPAETFSGCEPVREEVSLSPQAAKEESFSSLVAEDSVSDEAVKNDEQELEVPGKLSSLAAQQVEAREGPERVSETEGRDDLHTDVSVGRVTSRGASSTPRSRAESDAGAHADEVILTFGDRRWRVRGLQKNTALSVLKVNLFVSRGEAFHVDSLELYSARQRAAFVGQVKEELGVEERVIKADLGRILLELETLHERQLKGEKPMAANTPKLSDAEQKDALELLKDPKLLDRIACDLETCGIVGERVNKLVSYLAAVSRKLEKPLAIVIQSSSAAGKSSLMDAVLRLVPEEERIAYSAMTAQSLFYMGEHDLRHKVLAIAEEEGAREASYALKLLQSEGRVRIASTTKDPKTGQFVTRDHELEGPVMIFLTTTAIEVDEELLNRCIVLTVDEGREQTRAIHALQRQARTLEGLIVKEEQERLVRLHQNAQRLLQTLPVVNPFASELKFPDHQTRLRRDHTKYLGLIEAVALLHQYQRPIKETTHRGKVIRYVEVMRQDIEQANSLSAEVLRVTTDDLPPQTRRLLEELEELVSAQSQRLGVDRNDYRFSRREAREWTRLGMTQLRVHLERLVEMEYVVVHRAGPRRGHTVFYELVWTASSRPGSWRGFELSWRGDDGGLAEVAPSTESSRKQGEESSEDRVGGVIAESHQRAETKPERRSPSARSRAGTNGAGARRVPILSSAANPAGH